MLLQRWEAKILRNESSPQPGIELTSSQPQVMSPTRSPLSHPEIQRQRLERERNNLYVPYSGRRGLMHLRKKFLSSNSLANYGFLRLILSNSRPNHDVKGSLKCKEIEYCEKFRPMSACADWAGWPGSILFANIKPSFHKARLIWISVFTLFILIGSVYYQVMETEVSQETFLQSFPPPTKTHRDIIKISQSPWNVGLMQTFRLWSS